MVAAEGTRLKFLWRCRLNNSLVAFVQHSAGCRAIAGYCGGGINNLIMRFCELIMAIPGLYLIMAIRATYLRSYPWLLAPGVAILITVLAFNFLGDGLRDAVDTKVAA